jgi:uncharacterized protein
MEPGLIRPRRVQFDWRGTPLHWVPGDPFTSHLIGVLHLLLPAGEQWFVDVYREALPQVRDERLRADVRGFMGQEAIHARAHAAVLESLRSQGIETAPYTRKIDWMFERLLGSERTPRALRAPWLRFRLAGIAAIEHFTCVLGVWILEARALDRAGADPVMLDLLRWHGAEEIEHRSVAFELSRHLSGRLAYLGRVTAMLVVAPILAVLWYAGTRFMVRNDSTLRGRRFGWSDFFRAVRERRAPGRELVFSIPRFLRAGYHPRHEASTERALAYLTTSPAASAVR